MFTIISGSNARWGTDHRTITIDLKIRELGTIPLTASIDGPEAYLIDIYKRASCGEFGPIAEPDARTVGDFRAVAKARVDTEAEAYRLTFVTAGAGQAMAYRQKLEEAKAYLADTDLTAIECPHIFAEVGITGETAGAVASLIVARHAEWQAKSAKIEQQRLAAKAAIDAAETADAISLAGQIQWGT